MRSAPGSPGPSLAVVLVSACLVVLVWPAVAGADIFSPIRLVSYGTLGGDPEAQQAEYGHDAAMSADGRYVAFDGSVGGVTGVWRRDLQSGAIEQVAGGDAALPSISADGNEISFTTNEGDSLPEVSHERPDADPRPEAVNVYVRDMANSPAGAAAEEAARAPGERAFLIVSAPSGSSEPLRYTAPPTQATAQGSYAAGRSAISADGSEVAFVTTAISNLVAYPTLEAEERARGETPAPHTPAGQVVVRYLQTDTTELVSRCRSGCEPGAAEALVAGAAAVGEADFPGHPAAGGGPGASISADGSTVAWLGTNIAAQAPTLAAERLEPEYREPLWRRLPAGATQTVRISGGGDPANPACGASGETAPSSPPSLADPCQGPFVLEHAAGGGEPGGLWKGKSAGNSTPQLSEHGNVVAFLAQARLVSEGSDFGRGEGGQESDVYVANMEPGLSRVQALTPLSEVGPPDIGAESDPVGDLAISPDGGEVAFTSVRTFFPLGSPALISPPLAVPGISELYDADLREDTITRVTHGLAGGASEQPHETLSLSEEDPYEDSLARSLGAFSPSFSGDGNTLVFTSTASNLVYGDGNTPALTGAPLRPSGGPGDGSDVFAVSRARFVPQPVAQSVAAPPAVNTSPAWLLGAEALSRADGSVLLYVEVPGAGALHAAARATVLVTTPARHGRRAGRARREVLMRTVASTSARARGGELLTLRLALAKPYASLALGSGGLSAVVTVSFDAAGEPKLGQTLAATFRRTERTSAHRARSGRHARRGRRHR